jgi:hypothetical protein
MHHRTIGGATKNLEKINLLIDASQLFSEFSD